VFVLIAFGLSFSNFHPEKEDRETHGAKRKEHSVKRRYKARMVGGKIGEDLFERGLYAAGQTIHEYLGIVWAKLRDQI